MELRRFLAFGSGVGVAIGPDRLEMIAVSVRPGGVKVLGAGVIENYAGRPAAEWGAEYASFARKAGVQHVAATILLPRASVIVRVLAVPGVADKDLDSAVGYQIDTLHPFKEEDAVASWARLGQSPSVLVGIARRDVIDRWNTLFAEAGIKVAAFSFSAAALFAALRLHRQPPAAGFLAAVAGDESVEVYGESPSRPVFSAEFSEGHDRARQQAAAELRLDPETEMPPVSRLLPPPAQASADFDLSRSALAYAASVSGAASRLALGVNLLPEGERQQTSRLRYVPTAVLAALVVAALGGLWLYSVLEQRRFDSKIAAEIARLEPQARRLQAVEKEIQATRLRTLQLEKLRRRTREDMDVLAELTKLLPPPAWLTNLDITRQVVILGGEAGQGAALIKQLDDSPLFQNAEFLVPPARGQVGELFRIRAQREGVEP